MGGVGGGGGWCGWVVWVVWVGGVGGIAKRALATRRSKVDSSVAHDMRALARKITRRREVLEYGSSDGHVHLMAEQWALRDDALCGKRSPLHGRTSARLHAHKLSPKKAHRPMSVLYGYP